MTKDDDEEKTTTATSKKTTSIIEKVISSSRDNNNSSKQEQLNKSVLIVASSKEGETIKQQQVVGMRMEESEIVDQGDLVIDRKNCDNFNSSSHKKNTTTLSSLTNDNTTSEQSQQISSSGGGSIANTISSEEEEEELILINNNAAQNGLKKLNDKTMETQINKTSSLKEKDSELAEEETIVNDDMICDEQQREEKEEETANKIGTNEAIDDCKNIQQDSNMITEDIATSANQESQQQLSATTTNKSTSNYNIQQQQRIAKKHQQNVLMAQNQIQSSAEQQQQQQVPISADYLAQLIKDKKQLNAFPSVFIHVQRLIDEEINKVRQSLFQLNDVVHLNEPLELPEPEGELVQLQEKLYVPVGEHPEYNFVGRLLGPRGMTAKQLEQETGCKIMIRGKGSMRDKKKVSFIKAFSIITHLELLFTNFYLIKFIIK